MDLASKLLLLIAFSIATPGLAATIEVTGSSDVGPGSCDSPTRCTSLRAAIEQAAGGDMIQIPSGIVYLSSTLNITKDLTLNGVGATLVAIDGGGSFRVMSFSADSLTINNLQIQHGASSDGLGGAGLLIHSGDVAINRCTFTGNHSTVIGGAIQSAAALSIQRSTFFDNHAPTGAAIAIGSASSVSLHYSSVVNNTSMTNLLSAAIDNAGTFTAEGSVFNNPQDCAGSGNTLSLGYNLEAAQACNFITGTLTPDYANVNRSPVASALSAAGTTQVLLPDPAQSSLIDMGPSTCSGQDQAGVAVPQNIRCDLGAIETMAATLPSSGITGNENGFDDDEGHDDDDDDEHEREDDGIGAFGNPWLLVLVGFLRIFWLIIRQPKATALV